VNTFTEKNVVYLIGGYLEKSRYNTKLFLKKRKGNVQGTLAGVIPMNVGFLDAMADGRTLDFLLRNQLSKKNEENYEFILETKKATERIKKKLFPT
ncbi:MAG: hypothetical protein IJ274_12035, partial [Lachnospiraceae bacterium]|nr:hypothetical protein [Lachnospiraceae bacterium]